MQSVEERKNAYTEVYTILQELNEEEYEKIPDIVIKTIKENRNEQYDYEIDDELELKEQSMLPRTKAILFILFRDYLATQEQKQKIIKMQNEERQKNEAEKQKIYNINMFDNKQDTKIEEESSKQNIELIEYKENIFTSILSKIKKLFTKKQ